MRKSGRHILEPPPAIDMVTLIFFRVHASSWIRINDHYVMQFTQNRTRPVHIDGCDRTMASTDNKNRFVWVSTRSQPFGSKAKKDLEAARVKFERTSQKRFIEN
ncbi:uncharacterized protein PV06_03269 [Exophiala oligosperma]|uniref:Uncharacterized protein n=2 Tax=Chaetothyriales TaxID=34395 RepID=A0A0D2DQR9_9EURO|nr:uncharacterized protein PV06_03269 [Exophiala oligosperma]KAJ9642163.1 hypothetical protein H2204_002532 [Knufia peltigerae]KIW44825.1 hypothetical protein PV06_03269 [Exophiala oligosperma]